MKCTITINDTHKVVSFFESDASALAALLRGMLDDNGFVTLPEILEGE